MQWKIWQKPGPQELPATVKNTLMSQFKVTPQSMAKMRFLGQTGRFADRPVRFIRIFDPALILGGAAPKAKYHNFQLDSSGDRKALMFEGHIEKDGNVFLTDCRLPTEGFNSTGAVAGPVQ